MREVSEAELRASFVNASRKEVSGLTLLAGFDALDWESLDYLGWRDPKFSRRAYMTIPMLDDSLVGVMLTQGEKSPRSRAQCSWCQDVRLPNDVVYYTARRAGAAGRNGNSIGILVCDEFQCSRNVRRDPPLAYEGFDLAAARTRRIDNLRLFSAAFAEEVVATAARQ